MDTEISCNSNIDYKKINEVIPELKKYFKVSGLNLSKIGNKVSSGRQALGILRKLCSQARIPYEFDKTENGYTFSLTPLNEEWCGFLKALNDQEINKEIMDEKVIKAETIDDILEHKTPLVSRHHITDEEWNRLNPDIKYIDGLQNNPFYARAVTGQSYNSQKEFDFRYTCVKTICIHPENDNNSTVRVEGIPPVLYYLFGRRDDVIEKVKEVQLFDENMNSIEVERSDLILSNNNGYTGLEYKENIPVVLYPFSRLYLRVNMKEKDIRKSKIYLKIVYTCIQYSSVKIKKLPRKEISFPNENFYSERRYIACYFSKTWNLTEALGEFRKGKYRIVSNSPVKLLKNGELVEESKNIVVNFDALHEELKDFTHFEIEHNGEIFSVIKGEF